MAKDMNELSIQERARQIHQMKINELVTLIVKKQEEIKNLPPVEGLSPQQQLIRLMNDIQYTLQKMTLKEKLSILNEHLLKQNVK